ncbi:serine/arginine-rich splicing factor RS40-like isoform X1 [Cucurbita pepo subsp. pepo]|uniref:serine/arginine-rich splicing factor RS40-like isoform X1 n=2 Tax=Cucurbita pepo subsp. pepo TaxID=3664 RepID=UPI000C9DA1A8|nr:serine/arginine-rich splicing factor RS40-like isoform X1 [Cucurbita pepo subsp. pepo]
MKPIFCGNFEYDARQPDLERLFSRYGKVDRVDMKSGFAFIYMEDEREAEDAIRALDRREFGRKGRRLRVEWTKQERGIRRPGGGRGGGDSRRSSTNTKPSKTLFVINFDPYHTRTRDLERHFDPYGKILNVRIRRNFAFVQYELQEDATRALEITNMSKLMDRVISVEYAVRDDDEKRNGYSPDRTRDRSPDRKRRSPSPYRRERGSPDYGNGVSRSPYRKVRASPDYGSRRSPSPYQRVRERGSPEYGRGRSPNQSPYRRERERERSSDHARAPSHSPYRRERERERSSDHARAPSHSPPAPHQRERANGERAHSGIHSPYGRERGSPSEERRTSYSPRDRERSNPDNGHDQRPKTIAEPGDSPSYGGTQSPKHRGYKSRSPEAEE